MKMGFLVFFASPFTRLLSYTKNMCGGLLRAERGVGGQ
jgi:hypothetical protein